MRSLLVANRGEIAERIFRTARLMGLRTVAVYTAADAGSAHVASADTAVAVSSYLEGPAVVAAALRAGADAVHPGYGFLAENAGFAGSVIAAGLTWVGPRPESIAAMGDKLEAKRLMAAADVPVLTGGAVSDAEAVGYPLLVKATAGGGGKGMRLVTAPEELAGAVESASREAASAFGDGTVFVERWLAAPRHVEVQVIGDVQGRVVGLGERECSVQRRHQKIIEEAPSPGISAALRARLIEAAVAGTRAIRYVGVGTMEFLVAGEEFFFLEMNTRLQVEHPVTECVTGLDLVRLQLLVAQGEPLELVHTEVGMTGHAIEARLYAEDPSAGYLPSPGTLHRWRPGPTPGVRYDAGVVDGTVVPPDYDPLLAKIIVHASTRDEASARLARALRELEVHGPRTNRDQLVAVLEDPDWLAGATTTDFLERRPMLASSSLAPAVVVAHAAAAVLAGAAERQASAVVAAFATPGWRNVPTGPAQVTLAPAGGGDPVEVAYRLAPELEVIIGGTTMPGRAFAMGPELVDVEWDGVRVRARIHRVGDRIWVNTADGQTEWEEVPRFVTRGRRGGRPRTDGAPAGHRRHRLGHGGRTSLVRPGAGRARGDEDGASDRGPR